MSGSQVTVSGSTTGSTSDSTSTRVNKKGNFGSFQNSKNLTAIDTHGNVFKVPDFTIGQIIKAIPAECFERRLTSSFYYVFRDLALILSFGYAANTFIPMIPNQFLRGIAWLGYAALQSLPYTGWWVLAHECGHQAFSDYGWVNDSVGWILHSYLLVPYFSWKYSHGKHHKATGHLSKDMVFVPSKKDEFLAYNNSVSLSELSEDAPIVTLINLLKQQFGGWWAYLATNVTGQPYEGYENSKAVNHFNPSAPIFEKRDYWFIVLSDIGILCQLFVVYQWYQAFGGFHVFINWFLPYIFTNHWLVFITYLQHTDTRLPHYEAHEWNFARGAAATMDREFGFAGWFFLHDIIETHVLHHFVARIPFYNARPASEAIKAVMGDHYMHSDENMWKTLWRSARSCQFVDGKDGVYMYRNVNNIGIKPE